LQLLVDLTDATQFKLVNNTEAVLESLSFLLQGVFVCEVKHKGQWDHVPNLLLIRIAKLFQIAEQLVFLGYGPMELEVID
jgi:hypothetical protein